MNPYQEFLKAQQQKSQQAIQSRKNFENSILQKIDNDRKFNNQIRSSPTMEHINSYQQKVQSRQVPYPPYYQQPSLSDQQRQSEENLLNKFRKQRNDNLPPGLQSNANRQLMLDQQKLIHDQEQVRKAKLQRQNYQVNQKSNQLELEKSDDDMEYDQDEKLLFKQSIQNGTYGLPNKLMQKQKAQQNVIYKQNLLQNDPVNIIDLSDEEIEIVNKSNLISKQQIENQYKQFMNKPTLPQDQLFKQRFNNQTPPAQFTVNSIHTNFYNKYFSNEKLHSALPNTTYTSAKVSEHNLESFSAQNLRTLAKNNSFLKNQEAQVKLLSERIGANKYAVSHVENQSGYGQAKLSSFNQSKKDKYQEPQTAIINHQSNSSSLHYGRPMPDWNVLQDRANINQAYEKIQKKFQKQIKQQDDLKVEKLKKQKELFEHKKKQRLQNEKKVQDGVLDELFDYNFTSDGPKKKKKEIKKDGTGGLDGLGSSDNNENEKDGLNALRDQSSSSDDDSSQSDAESGEINDDETEIKLEQMNQSEIDQYNQSMIELQLKRAQEAQQREFDEKMRQIRYKNRKNVDELILPILNLDLVNMFAEEEKAEFQVLPQIFENSVQYFQTWLHLFLYETYNQLINQRNDSDKDRELSKLYGMRVKNDNAQKNFTGHIQRHNQDQSFIYLKLYEENNKDGKSNDTKQIIFPHIGSLKEFDLLLLSETELETTNVKKLTSASFLKEIQTKTGTFMAIVNSSRKFDKNYIEIKIDISHDKYVNMNCSEFQSHKIHVYYFDSMSTRIREFRTIKSAEFFPCAKYILDPRNIPKKSDYLSSLEEENERIKNKSPICNKNKTNMANFVEQHKEKFNQSQYQALIDVSNMKTVDFLLIQGPPGTGKTHTIKGIISMLNASLKDNRKILVCAPSNAAIDEIVTRLISKGGLLGQNEKQSIEKVLRIGSFEYEPSQIVKQVTMETKLKQCTNLLDTKEEKETEITMKQKWQIDLQNIDKILQLIEKSKAKAHQESKDIKVLASKLLANQNQIEDFMKYEKEKKMQKVKKYRDLVKNNIAQFDFDKSQSHKQMTKQQRLNLEKKIVENTQIICTTLAMSVNEKLDCLSPGDIDYLIVDEACQSVELNNLIPFEHQPQKIILVGDQQQLPATTFSENAERTNYSRSMFERFLQCGVEKVMLEIQYRMDPLIREFPSLQFYENRLKDDESITLRTKTKKFLDSSVSEIKKEFAAVQFYDLQYSQESASEKSKTNQDEVKFIELLIKEFLFNIIIKNEEIKEDFNNQAKLQQLVKDFNSSSLKQKKRNAIEQIKGCIGIISPYKSQVRNLKDTIFQLLKSFCDIYNPQEYIEINTVDAFQGREKDIIIFSCVRSSKDGGLGFVSDYRRMNVAITRAKHNLFVIGNESTLKRDPNWNALIKYCQNQQQVHKKSYNSIKTQNSSEHFFKFNNSIEEKKKEVQIQRKEQPKDIKISTNQLPKQDKFTLRSPQSVLSKEQNKPRSLDKSKEKVKDDDIGLEGLKSPERSKSPISYKFSSNKFSDTMSYTDLFQQKNPNEEPQLQENQQQVNNLKYTQEDGEIQNCSSGQIADKRTTNTDDPVSKNSSETKQQVPSNQLNDSERQKSNNEKQKGSGDLFIQKKKNKIDDDQSSYQSYCSKTKYYTAYEKKKLEMQNYKQSSYNKWDSSDNWKEDQNLKFNQNNRSDKKYDSYNSQKNSQKIESNQNAKIDNRMKRFGMNRDRSPTRDISQNRYNNHYQNQRSHSRSQSPIGQQNWQRKRDGKNYDKSYDKNQRDQYVARRQQNYNQNYGKRPRY